MKRETHCGGQGMSSTPRLDLTIRAQSLKASTVDKCLPRCSCGPDCHEDRKVVQPMSRRGSWRWAFCVSARCVPSRGHAAGNARAGQPAAGLPVTPRDHGR
jgi:hypothetical protein